MLPEYDALRKRCAALCWPNTNEAVFTCADLARLDEAFLFAEAAHSTNKPRHSGDAYITHPVATAQLLLDIEMIDLDCLIAALLHDVVEDVEEVSEQDIHTRFGETIGSMVEGLTKLSKLNFATQELAQAENVMKMLLSMLRDFRVIVVKLADRLHNMRTLHFHPKEQSRLRIANETMLIYVPIADMLGIRLFKEELEDIAIRALDPHGCAEIDAWLAADKAQRQVFLQTIQNNLHSHLSKRFAESGVNNNVHVEGRVKSMHGIYRKHFTQGRGFEEIFDIYAVRVIVQSEEECWAVLGWVHQIYREIPKRQKNYISSPKPNGYQSLHLTMVGDDKIPFEVQIRTWDMHEIAERGVAGHWKYKQGIGARQTGLEEQLARIQELIDSYRDADSVEDVVAAIRSDISPMEKVYPVTPKGEAKELKLGATVLDFAYAVHTGVGHRFAGAKVNGRIAPSTYQVQSGDVVEILTTADRERGPSRDWLQVVVTSQAKTKIRNWFKKERREDNILTGQKLVEGEHRRNFTLMDANQWEEILLRVLDRKQFEKGITTTTRIENFYAALGYGGLSMQSFLPLLREEYQKIVRQQQEVKLKKITSDKGVVVQGIDNCQVKFAQCCHPVPQDNIIGYITRSSVRDAQLRPGGVTVHRTSCLNVPRDIPNSPEPDRWLQAAWENNTVSNDYLGSITVHTNGRTGLLADVTSVFKHMHVDVSSLQLFPHSDGSSKICAVIAVHSRSHLDAIRQKIHAVKGVVSIDN